MTNALISVVLAVFALHGAPNRLSVLTGSSASPSLSPKHIAIGLFALFDGGTAADSNDDSSSNSSPKKDPPKDPPPPDPPPPPPPPPPPGGHKPPPPSCHRDDDCDLGGR